MIANVENMMTTTPRAEDRPQHGDDAVRKYPLWKNCLENMLKTGVAHGQKYRAEFFEAELDLKRDTMAFGLALSEIRRKLEVLGYYLSGRGLNGNEFTILQPEGNTDVLEQYDRAGREAYRRAHALGRATRTELMNEHDRKRHEKVMEKIATRLALVSRSRSVVKALGEKAPKLLAEKGAED